MRLRSKMLDFCTDMLISPFRLLPRRKREMALSALAKRSIPIISEDTKHGLIKFFSIGRIATFRAHTLLSKEAGTISWIDEFKDGSFMWDIGANIGCYSLYAAKMGIKVIAFEPSAFNYFALCKNIEINKLDDDIMALNIAFANSTKLGYLNISNSEIGGAISLFGEQNDRIKSIGKEFNVMFKQGALSFTIDDFMAHFNPPAPNYIKLDVDGTEAQIIEGASKTLSGKGLISLLVEFSEDSPALIPTIGLLKGYGMHLLKRDLLYPKTEDNPSAIYNYIFYRDY